MVPSLVSILIPAHNAQNWIRDAVSSALAQSWTNTEIIIVDDGSRDRTLEIARTFQSGRVKVIAQENRGAAAARNRALSLAQGDYIQWLDADDLLAPDKISEQLKYPEAEDPDILLSAPFGDFFCRPEKAVFSRTLLWQDLPPVDWIVTKYENNLWMNIHGWLASRRLTEAAGPWDERLSFDDDGEYSCRLIARSKLVKFVPTAKVYYRHWSSGSMSESLSEKACSSMMMSLRLSFGHLLSLEDSPRTRSAALSYLQVWMPCFYPDKAELLEQAYSMANELGGSLHPPKLPRKYEPIRRFLGWQAAYSAMRTVAASKLRVRLTLDELIWKLSGARTIE
jgi:hypothetical protein